MCIKRQITIATMKTSLILSLLHTARDTPAHTSRTALQLMADFRQKQNKTPPKQQQQQQQNKNGEGFEVYLQLCFILCLLAPATQRFLGSGNSHPPSPTSRGLDTHQGMDISA